MRGQTGGSEFVALRGVVGDGHDMDGVRGGGRREEGVAGCVAVCLGFVVAPAMRSYFVAEVLVDGCGRGK